MDEYLVYIDFVGKDGNDQYLYELYVAKDPTLVFGDFWDVLPIGMCSKDQKKPHPSTIDDKIEIRLPILLKLAQNNNSLSMTDVTDNILALAWQDLSFYEEYPEYRLVLHYGENLKVVQDKLNKSIECHVNEED